MTPQEYTKQLKYLPDFIKDFHDQKDLFKTIQDLYKENESLKDLPNSWRENHIYVIDYFLWFMGQHGYKLQKIRGKYQFHDLNKTIEEYKEKSAKHFSEILQQALTNKSTL